MTKDTTNMVAATFAAYPKAQTLFYADGDTSNLFFELQACEQHRVSRKLGSVMQISRKALDKEIKALETNSKSKTKPKTDEKTEVDAKTKPKTDEKTEVDAKTKPKTDEKTEVDAKTKPKTDEKTVDIF